MRLPLRSVAPVLLACAALIGFGAGDLTLPGTPGAPAVNAIVPGDGQEAPVGAPLRDSLIVKVSDADGIAVPAQQEAHVAAGLAGMATVTMMTTTAMMRMTKTAMRSGVMAGGGGGKPGRG